MRTHRPGQIVDCSYFGKLMNVLTGDKHSIGKSLRTMLKLGFLAILILLFVDVGPAAALFIEEDRLEGVGGRSVAMGGNRLVVSGLSPDRTTTAVYVYRNDNGTWLREQVLLGGDYSFGYSVAINSTGDLIVVGEPGFFSGYGAAHVFRWYAGLAQWKKEQTISNWSDDRFGFSTAIVGDRIAIGAPFADSREWNLGAVYVYRGEEISPGHMWWSQEEILVAPDGAPGDQLGYSLAMKGDRIVAGAIVNRHNSVWSGSAYVFNRAWGYWRLETELTPPDGMNGDFFGDSVSISSDPISGGDRVVVGTGFAVSAYVFRLFDYGIWALEDKLGPFDEHPGYICICPEDRSAVAISGERIVVGARRSLTDSQWGVHLFEFDSGIGGTRKWAPGQILTGTGDGEFAQRFGRSVAISDDRIVIGEPVADTAYIFRFAEDSDGDGVPNELDQCPVADTTPTVIVDSCDSGVANALVVDPAGCTINQAITNFVAEANSHGQFVSDVDKLLLQLQKAEIIDSNEKNAIKDCAAQSSLP